MRSVYKVLAYVLAAEVVIQAMAMVYAVAGQGKWVMEGGVLDKAVVESREFVFPEVLGYAIHGINGAIVIPAARVGPARLLLLREGSRRREMGRPGGPVGSPAGHPRHRRPLDSVPGCVARPQRAAAVRRRNL